MFAWIIGILFAIWMFFRIVSQLVMWPDNSENQEPSEWPMILLGYVLAGAELVFISWWHGGL